jgi:glycosyltransferase involved in cell wall biosynthesis
MSNLRQIALVLGMHRSGTSALASLISRLGFDLGKNLMPGNEFNAGGYYENEKLVQFHGEILDRLGSSWHDLRFLPVSAFLGGWIDDAAQGLSGILQEEFGDASRIVVKDPRASRLLPVWHRLAQERDLDLRFLLIGRHPLQVSYSLAHRDAFSRQKSLLLWLQYNLAAERGSRSGRRLILRYQELMAQPEEMARQLAAFLGVESAEELAEAAAAVDSSFAHHLAETKSFCEQPEIQRWTAKVWQTLFLHQRLTEAAQKRLDHVAEEVRERLSILPEEASGRGDYEAATAKRANAALKERYEAKSRDLLEVARQRDEARKAADATRQDHKSLKERYQERDQLLQAVMLHRDEARKQIEALAAAAAIGEKKHKALEEECLKLAAAAEQRIRREVDAARKKLRQTEEKLERAKTERARAESKLAKADARVRTLDAAEQQRTVLTEMLQRAAVEIGEREARRATLERELETLRHEWTALPVRRELKKLVGPFAAGATDLVHLNGVTPAVWNHSRAGFRFGASVFPDLERPGGCLIEGWILPEEGKMPPPPLRLVSESGLRRGAKGARQRVDIPLLFPDDPRAANCGFALFDLKKFDGALCRLEVRKPPGEWVPLALIDLNGIGSQHLGEIAQIAASQLFDSAWYARRYRLTELSDLALISHYLREGAARVFFPNPLFDTAYYLQLNPGIWETGENPLLHYLRAAGKGTASSPNKFFDPVWYLKQHRDVAATGIDPLAHYLRFGKREGRNPGPQFDAAAYLRANPDVQQSSLDALSHYLHYGSAEGRGVSKPEDAIRWIHEAASDADDGKTNLLLVGHVLGKTMFGGERSLLELIQLIDRDRFNIYCSFPQASGALLEKIKPFLAGIAVFPYKWWLGSESATDGYERQFESLMRARRIGLVHVNSIVLRDPLVAAKRLGIPSVLHLREIITFDPDLAKRIGLPPEQIASEVNNRCDFVIANSHFTQEQQGNPSRSFVLYNTADEAAFDLPPREREGPLRVGMLSSNLPKKGLEDFFKIAQHAQEENDSLEFWLVGPETDCIRQHFERNGGCPANVRCVGYVDNPPDVLREIDVIINLSTFAESFGRSVAEGMLARRPAVVYEHGALPELIRDGVDGFVVPFRDAEAARERLNRLARDPDLLAAMGESARRRAVENFSRAVGAQTLERIYDTVLRSSSPESANGSEPRAASRPVEFAPPTKRMRIGYFMWHFPVPSETFVLNELRDFVRLGHDVLVFCKESPHKEFEPDFPIEWQRVKSPDELAAKMKESGREIMHSHFVFPTVTQFLWPACELAGVPFTFIAHAVDLFRHENAARNRLGEVARSPMCRRVFAPGTFHRDFFIQNGVPEEKIIVSPQGILFDAYEAQPIAPRLQRPRMSVCAIHRFIEKKGLSDAIRAAKELATHGISLHLYGYGPLEDSYRALVAELGLENVFFPGPVKDRSHMISVFREHDLFLCPSVRATDGDMDGIPTILIEAMASHVPVVASRVSSIPDLVIDGLTGYLCEPGDVDSLTRSILRFYREPVAQVRAMIENAREHVRKHFDVMKSNRTLVRAWAGEGLDVILVTYNATAEVREVIDRLYRFTKTPFQLYLVDNGSEPETLEYLRSVETAHDNVRLLPQAENLFVGPGTNKGMEAARAPIAAYLCSREGYVIAEGWDQAILDYMDDHPRVGLAGTLGYSPSYFTGADYIEQLEPFPRFRNPEFAAQNRDRRFRHVQGGMFAIRRAMFESIGGFSEAMPHNHTDVEYSYYVESCGWQLGQIPDLVIIYQKSRPLLTTRLDESVYAVHPGSLTLSPLLDSVVRLETNFCNVCGHAVSFAQSPNLVCPICGATPFHRSFYRYLAESTLTYRQLLALQIGESDWLLPDWQKMFRGRAIDYPGLVSEMEAKGQIDHPDDRLDLVVLRLPDTVQVAPPDLLSETARILKPGGHLLYFQLYGIEPILNSAPNGLSDPDQIAAMLESHHFQVQARVRYASAALCYSEHEIFVCRQPMPA